MSDDNQAAADRLKDRILAGAERLRHPSGNDIGFGDVVQIDPAYKGFGGCFLIVEFVAAWGVQGYVPVPSSDVASAAYLRLAFNDIQKIGSVGWRRVQTT